MIEIFRWKSISAEQKEKILQRSAQDINAFVPQAQKIIDRVKQGGDQAVIECTREFDGADISGLGLRVSQEEIDAAETQLEQEVREAIEISYRNIRTFHERQMPEELWMTEIAPGLMGAKRFHQLTAVCFMFHAGRQRILRSC